MTAESDETDATRQRTLTGRLLASALGEIDRADAAEAESARMAYLTDLDHQLLGSLDGGRTRDTISHVVLPELDAWAVVDVLEPSGVATRLTIVHPSFAKKASVAALNVRWQPRDDDPIGYPAAKRAGNTIAIVDGVDAVVAAAAHTEENHAILRELGVGACLVVPMRDGDTINGAITFMSAHSRTRYTDAELAFAERIAAACGRALANAGLFELLNERRTIAEETNRARSQMLGHVTHELRTPLNAIGGYAELIELGLRGPVTEQQKKDLARIRWNQEHLLSMITQILNFVRIDTGQARFELVSFELGAAMRSAAEMLEPLVADKRHALRFEWEDDGAAVVFADPEAVRQIAINLITNALKYSPADSEIVVRCGGAGAVGFAEVADRGPGIPADKLESIFEPFVQLPESTASRAGGVGLGLAIARQLARGMHGDLTVTSEVGSGTTFRLTLPHGSLGRRRAADAPT